MDIKYFGDNFIPGLNVKNVNAKVINPLMNAGAQVSKAYGEYGENLRQALGQEPDDFSKQFLAGKIADKKQQKTGGNITRVGGKTYRMDNPADVKALEAVLAADQESRPGQQFADLRGGGGMKTKTPPVGPVSPPSPSTDPRNDAYLSARAKLTKDSTAEDIKKVEDIGMTAWAKANPELAAKVKPGQSGYEQIFADKRKEKVMDMMKTLNNPNIKPIVENINIPSTNFTGNLTGGISGIDYKDVMQDGAITELAKGLDLEAPQFNPQDFMNAFRDDVINVEKTPQKNGLGKVLDLPDVNNLLSTLGKDEYFRQLDAGLLTK